MLRIVCKYAFILFIALSGLKFLEFQFFSQKLSLEIYLMIVATVFLLAGYFLSKYFSDKKTPINLAAEIDQQRLDEFSPREQQVLLLLSHGYTNKEIAKSLSISPNTVKTHTRNVFGKLGVTNRTQAVSEARILNIIS